MKWGYKYIKTISLCIDLYGCRVLIQVITHYLQSSYNLYKWFTEWASSIVFCLWIFALVYVPSWFGQIIYLDIAQTSALSFYFITEGYFDKSRISFK